MRQIKTEVRRENRRIERAVTEEVVRRLVTRGERIEPPAPAKGPVIARPEAKRPTGPTVEPVRSRSARAMPPVPRITRRPAAIGAERTGPTAESHRPAVPSEQPGPELAPADLNRLTDQVVRTIDQRMIAHRERMGRI